MEAKMQINITDEAKNQLRELFGKSNYVEPALRVFIAGMG
jgi:Fe-S cluster assembly iron-binding protein IscA